MRLSMLLLLCAAFVGTSCGKKSTAVEELPYLPYAVEELVVGSGAATAMGNLLTVHFTSAVFGGDSLTNTRANNGSPVQVTIGIEALIEGLETGLLGMQVGGTRRVTIPPELAFGDEGIGQIPPKATLIYVIELIAVDSSFTIVDLVVGAGTKPYPGSQLTVAYVGRLQDGTVFDSATAQNPFTFVIGADIAQVIQGWDEGLRSMKVGGKRKLTIPPSKGYGAAGSAPAVPPNATLIFEVELLKVV